MTQQLSRTLHRLDLKWFRFIRLACLRRFFRIVWNHIVACPCPGARGGRRYRRLSGCFLSRNFMVDDDDDEPPEACAELYTAEASVATEAAAAPAYKDIEADGADVVSLKVILLGDCHIGKTSFMVKYVGGTEEEQKGLQMTGFNLMDKVLVVRGTRIVFSIWDIGGDDHCLDHMPIACKDAAAVLVMFDLTSRCTLNNAIGWFQKARRWNKTAIPILIGTKFDDFVQLPLEMQWMIVNQARAYARAMNATLFFSSATHNINVNKIFKFITAKLFNLPWNIERNLTVGEPIIDFY